MGDEGKKSFFNAGMAQAERVDILQRILNDARFNPTLLNMQYGKLNFEIMLMACQGLLKECWGKLTPGEKEGGKKIHDLAKSYLDLNPIIIISDRDTKINTKHLKKFTELIDMYEDTMREYLEAHDMNSPNKEIEDDDEL